MLGHFQLTPETEDFKQGYEIEIAKRRKYIKDNFADPTNREADFEVINSTKEAIKDYYQIFSIEISLDDMPEVYVVRPDNIPTGTGKREYFAALLEHNDYAWNHYQPRGHYAYVLDIPNNPGFKSLSYSIAHEIFHGLGCKLIEVKKNLENNDDPDGYSLRPIYNGLNCSSFLDKLWDGSLIEEGLASRLARIISNQHDIAQYFPGYRDAEIIVDKIIADGLSLGFEMEKLLYKAHFDVREGSALISAIDQIYGQGKAYKLFKIEHRAQDSYQKVIDSLIPINH